MKSWNRYFLGPILSSFLTVSAGCVLPENEQFFEETANEESSMLVGEDTEVIAPTPTPFATPTATPVVVSLVETHLIPSQAKMDLLFVIDNSLSMVPYQQQVSQSIAQFIGQFQSKDIDFQIGVATTMTYKPALSPSQYSPSNAQSPFAAYMANAPEQGKLISRFPGELWLNRNSQNLVQKFGGTYNAGTRLYQGGNANVGAFNNNSGVYAGIERLDDSALSVLDIARISNGGSNSGFIRSEANLATILVSDEDRSCVSDYYVGVNDTYCSDNQITELKNRFKNRMDELVQTGKTRGYTMNFIVNTSSSRPSDSRRRGQTGVLEYPFTYLAMAQHFGTTALNIKSNFSPSLIALGGDLAAEAQLAYQLNQQPQNALEIVVKIDGIVQATPGAYIYNAVQNKVVLSQATYNSSRGKQLSIEYVAAQ